MFGGKTRHVWHPIRIFVFVLCPRLDATDSKYTAQEMNLILLYR